MPYGVSKHKPYFGVGTYSGFGEVFDVNSNQWYQSPSVFSDDFSTDTGWLLTGATKVVANSTITFTNSGAASGYISKAITTIAGYRYRVKFKYSLGSSAGASVLIGTTQNGAELTSIAYTASTDSYVDFVATGTTTYISMKNTSTTSGQGSTFDDISAYPINGFNEVYLSSATPITASRSYLNAKVLADAGGQPTLVEQLPKVEYKKDLEVDTLKVYGGFDLNQKWYDVTASRVLGATYTNTSGKPKLVNIVAVRSNAAGVLGIAVNGVSTGDLTIAQAVQGFVCAIVPNGATYSISGATLTSIIAWKEMY